MLGFIGKWASSKGMGRIPDLEGLTLNEARTAITNAGFNLGNETSRGNANGANSSNHGKAKRREDTDSLLDYESVVDFEYYSYVETPAPTPSTPTPTSTTPTPTSTTPTPTSTTPTPTLPALTMPTLSYYVGWQIYPGSVYANIDVTNFDYGSDISYSSSLGSQNPEFPEQWNLSDLTPGQQYTVYITASKNGYSSSTASVTFTAYPSSTPSPTPTPTGPTYDYIMPSVVGLTESAAAAAIAAHGINYEFTYYYGNSQGATSSNNGIVAAQDPSAGTSLPPVAGGGAALTIYQYTSTPTPTSTTPSPTDPTWYFCCADGTAESVLAADSSSAVTLANNICRQNGSTVSGGVYSTVQSCSTTPTPTAPTTFTIPNLVGLYNPSGTSEYNVSEGSSVQTTDYTKIGLVQSQSPAAGTVVNASPVPTITVYRYVYQSTPSPTSTTPSPVSTTPAPVDCTTVVRYIPASGWDTSPDSSCASGYKYYKVAVKNDGCTNDIIWGDCTSQTWYCTLNATDEQNQYTSASDVSTSQCDSYAIACSTSGYPGYPTIPTCPPAPTPTGGGSTPTPTGGGSTPTPTGGGSTPTPTGPAPCVYNGNVTFSPCGFNVCVYDNCGNFLGYTST